jgi:hypothetical protein
MADIDLKTETPDTSIDDNAVLFGADSQSAASPSVFSVATLREHIEDTANTFTAKQTINLSGEQLALGAAGSNSGVMSLAGSTSGKVTVQAAAAAGTYTLTLPTSDGDAGQFLKTDGSGVLSWGAVGGTPGGSDTQVQFNDGGVFGGDAGLTFNKTAKTITLGGGTVTTSSPVIDAAQTWNDGAVAFTGLKFNATDTASAAASLLMDLQVGGVKQFYVLKTGDVKIGTHATIFSQSGGSNLSGIKFGGQTQGSLTFYVGDGTAAANLINDYAGQAPGLTLRNQLQFSSSSASLTAPDTFMGRRAAANLRLGAADAAAPVAQTLSVQSVVAGTTNTAGANLTITGSQGTGTGAGGSIIFQVAPAGSSGTAQNSLVTFLEATSARAFNLYNTTDVTTNFERGKIAWDSNVLKIGTEKGGTGTARALEFQTDGTSRWSVGATTGHLLASADNTYDIGASGANRPRAIYTAGNVSVGNDLLMNMGVGAGISFGAGYGSITRGISGALALGLNPGSTLNYAVEVVNAANAMTFRTYGTFTDASNYRRVALAMTTAGVATLKPEGAGTGASGNVLHISGLPTSNPGAGILWNNGGTVEVGT